MSGRLVKLRPVGQWVVDPQSRRDNPMVAGPRPPRIQTETAAHWYNRGMSDELIQHDSPAQKSLKVAAWVYIVLICVGQFTGLLDRIAPGRYGRLVTPMGVALVILAYRRPGRRGRLFFLSGLAVIAALSCYQFGRH